MISDKAKRYIERNNLNDNKLRCPRDNSTSFEIKGTSIDDVENVYVRCSCGMVYNMNTSKWLCGIE